MHDGSSGTIALGLSWDSGRIRRVLALALVLLLAVALFAAAVIGTTGANAEVAEGDGGMVVAGASWSGPAFSFTPGGIGTFGASWS